MPITAKSYNEVLNLCSQNAECFNNIQMNRGPRIELHFYNRTNEMSPLFASVMKLKKEEEKKKKMEEKKKKMKKKKDLEQVTQQ